MVSTLRWMPGRSAKRIKPASRRTGFLLCSRVLGLIPGYFFDTAGVPARFKFGLEPDPNHAIDQFAPQQIGRKTENIGVIVPAAHLGSNAVVTRGGPDAGN